MSDENAPKRSRPQPHPGDLVWGAIAIAATLNINKRQAFFLLEKKRIPARKIGGRWCASRAKILEACGG